MNIQTSEYCAVGHPDRTCDFIVAYIFDRYLERDPNARVALECQLKDSFATLSGEVTSLIQFMDRALTRYVREAIRQIGYTNHYRDMKYSNLVIAIPHSSGHPHEDEDA